MVYLLSAKLYSSIAWRQKARSKVYDDSRVEKCVEMFDFDSTLVVATTNNQSESNESSFLPCISSHGQCKVRSHTGSRKTCCTKATWVRREHLPVFFLSNVSEHDGLEVGKQASEPDVHRSVPTLQVPTANATDLMISSVWFQQMTRVVETDKNSHKRAKRPLTRQRDPKYF